LDDTLMRTRPFRSHRQRTHIFCCSFVVPQLEALLFSKFFHHLVPGDASQSFQAHIVSTTCDMRATNLVFRDDVFIINEIDAPFAIKGGIVKNLQIELPIVGAALFTKNIKVPHRAPDQCPHHPPLTTHTHQVSISGLYLVLRLADRDHIAEDMPHSIVSHIVAELQVRPACIAFSSSAHCFTRNSRTQSPRSCRHQCSRQTTRIQIPTGNIGLTTHHPQLTHPQLHREANRQNNGWTQWLLPPSLYPHCSPAPDSPAGSLNASPKTLKFP